MINALNSVNRRLCSYWLVTALVLVQIKLICKCTLASNQARCGHNKWRSYHRAEKGKGYC